MAGQTATGSSSSPSVGGTIAAGGSTVNASAGGTIATTSTADAGADVPVDGIDARPTPDAARDAAADALPPDGMASRDGHGDAGVWASCTDESPIPRKDDNYTCGTCASDLMWPLVCSQGRLQCATSWTGSNGTVYTVPPDQYVMSISDWMNWTGQCAYLAPTTYPGFALVEPGSATTDFAVGDGLLLKAESSSAMVKPTFDWLKADRTSGEQIIRSLVTLTDMTKNVPVAYTIADPIMDAVWRTETVALQPSAPLAANTWYRVTVFPGDSQPQAKCHTFNRLRTAWLTAPETTDIYTYSRPMVATITLASKSASTGKIIFAFTENLQGTDLSANPTAQVAVDGRTLSDCLNPYPCSGNTPTEFSTFEMVSAGIPSSFTEITLRVAHSMKAVKGGTILDGTAGNPNAKVDGAWAVYTFKAADMVVLPSGLEQVWYHGGI